MFDLPKMTHAAAAAIAEFAKAHPDEHFYGFAIDANMLCLNSEEAFSQCLAEYQQRCPDLYADAESMQELKANTGDWEYQGFFELDESHGFDGTAYQDHYDEASSTEDGRAPHTPYAQAMDALVAALALVEAFQGLTRTPDFVATWVDHNY